MARTGRPTAKRRNRVIVASGAMLVASSAAGVAVTGAAPVQASSHREAPLIAGDPKVDNTDVYSFVSADAPGMVNVITDWIPFEEPNGGPNFYPFADGAHYDIKIDNDGDGVPDVTYQWVFTSHVKDAAGEFLYNTGVVNSVNDATLNFTQTYTISKITSAGSTDILTDAETVPSDTGVASMPNYAGLRAEGVKTVGSAKYFAGQADDPFFLDLRIFDLLYGTTLKEAGQDTLAGYNVNTIAMQVPQSDVALAGDATSNPVIGVWSTAERPSVTTLSAGMAATSGDYVQVSRLGNPLVNEVVVPLKYKDAFNGLPPAMDHTIADVVAKVTTPIVPALIQSIYNIQAPATPRNDLVEIFLTGIAKNAPTLDGSTPPIQADLNSQVLNKGVTASKFVPAEEERLNMGVAPTASPNRLGVLGGDLQGFPNGRRLTDDVVDIELQALEGAAQTGKLVSALAGGDGVNANDEAFTSSFPYVGLPHTAAVNESLRGASAGASAGTATGSSSTPTGGVATGGGGTAFSFTSGPVDTAIAAAGLLLIGVGGVSVRRTRRRS